MISDGEMVPRGDSLACIPGKSAKTWMVLKLDKNQRALKPGNVKLGYVNM